ncbi:MAG: hypothetical protein J4G13_09230 [Dehalococcoidia bacterium]|nr:hypothetical protein [Dehalococcoidia bacterium]
MTERRKMPYDEQKRRGQAIYDAQIRHQIAPEDESKYVLVDVLTGDYEIAERSAEARSKLRRRRPNAVIHTMRRHKTYVGRLRSPRRFMRNEKGAQ